MKMSVDTLISYGWLTGSSSLVLITPSLESVNLIRFCRLLMRRCTSNCDSIRRFVRSSFVSEDGRMGSEVLNAQDGRAGEVDAENGKCRKLWVAHPDAVQ